MSNKKEQQQAELVKLIEEAHMNIIKAIASTYTSEQLEVALTLRREMEGVRDRSLTANLSASQINPFDTPPWEMEAVDGESDNDS